MDHDALKRLLLNEAKQVIRGQASKMLPDLTVEKAKYIQGLNEGALDSLVKKLNQ